jgi:hypothetical protein
MIDRAMGLGAVGVIEGTGRMVARLEVETIGTVAKDVEGGVVGLHREDVGQEAFAAGAAALGAAEGLGFASSPRRGKEFFADGLSEGGVGGVDFGIEGMEGSKGGFVEGALHLGGEDVGEIQGLLRVP